MIFLHSRTVRHEIACPAYILIRATEEGQELKVINMDSRHNHHANEELYKQLPHQKNLQRIEEKLAKTAARKHELKEQYEQKKKRVRVKKVATVQQEVCHNFDIDDGKLMLSCVLHLPKYQKS